MAHERERLYDITQPWLRDQMARFIENPQGLSLREDLAMVRVIFQGILNDCDSHAAAVGKLGQIEKMLEKLDKITSNINKVEQQQNLVLSKAAIIALGQTIGTILFRALEHVPDRERIVDTVSNEILEGIVLSKNEEIV
jgi:hypothetical protein